MPYHILKEYQMPDDYRILHYFFPKWRQEWCVYLSLSTKEDIPIPMKEHTHPYKKERTLSPS